MSRERGNRRERTLVGDDDFALYKDWLSQSCKRWSVAIWAYCLMPNHVHLILVPGDASGWRWRWGARIGATPPISTRGRARRGICFRVGSVRVGCDG